MSLKQLSLYVVIGSLLLMLMLFQWGVIGFILYIVVGVISMIILIVKHITSKGLAVCFTIYLLFIFVAYHVLLGNFARPSTVDITPFSQLEDVYFEDIDVAVRYLEQSIEELGGVNPKKDNDGTRIDFTYNYREKSDANPYPLTPSVNVRVYFFLTSEEAEEYFNGYKRLRRDNDYGKTLYAPISNNVEALLESSRLCRNADAFYTYDSERHIVTHARVGNSYVSFTEDADRKLIGNITSEAIEKLCKVLVEWVAQNPTQIHVQ